MLLLQLLLIALNAVFACAEIAVLGISDTKLNKMADEGNKRAKRLARLTKQPARFLSTIQVAITLSGFLGSAFAAENFAEPLAKWAISLGAPAAYLTTYETIALILVTLILSYITLIFGELVPKRVAQRKAEAVALALSAPISFIAKLFAPIVWLLTVSTNGILRLIGIDPNANEEEASEEDILMMVDVGNQSGAIDNEEKEFIQNIFEFDDLTAGELATHRTDVAMLWMDEDMEEWDKTVHENRHTMYPVCHETVDNVVGVLNAKDYFRLDNHDRETVMREAVRPAYFVPEGVKADLLFRNMKKTRNRIAIVLDEYGGVLGIVTVNDLVERLVGNVDDEEAATEEKVEQILALEDGTWQIRGTATIGEVEETLGVELSDDDFDTFGGLVFAALGQIPEDGTTCEVTTDKLQIRVTNVVDHQMDTAIVTVIAPDEEDEDENEDDDGED
ncbi:MAG: HlyC/CorC family transporter [Clostridia bacterium]|nr:HlyC/CorC family transporter [Clostridia bacterium]